MHDNHPTLSLRSAARSGLILAALWLAAALPGSEAGADVIKTNSQNCPSGYHHVTVDEARNHRLALCDLLNDSDLARIGGYGSLGGAASGCSVQVPDWQSTSHALCTNASDGDSRHDYFTNLLSNPRADTENMAGWQVLQNGGNGWLVDSQFATSYEWATRRQVVDLSLHDFDANTLDYHKPAIVVSEEFTKVFCPDDYFLKVELLDAQLNVLADWDSGVQRSAGTCHGPDEPEKLLHVFQDYPAGVRFVRWEDGGKDSEWWWGHFGARLDDAQLYLVSPNLLSNPDLESGDLEDWDILEDGGNGALVIGGAGYQGSQALVTSYELFRRSQLVNLVGKGYSAASLDQAPTVYVSEFFRRSFCQDPYFLKVELLDANFDVLAAWDSGLRQTGGECDWNTRWQALDHTFYDYGPGLRYIRWEDGGKDSEWWWGHFGVVMDRAYLGLRESRPHPTDRRLDMLAARECGGLGEEPCKVHGTKISNWCYVLFLGEFLCHEYETVTTSCNNELEIHGDRCVPPEIGLLDVWGEGRIVDPPLVTGFPDAYNLNKDTQKISNGPDSGADIPLLLSVSSYDYPQFPVFDSSVQYLTLMGAPITPHTAQEMVRVLKPGGRVVLFDPAPQQRLNFENNMGGLVRKHQSNLCSQPPFDGIVLAGPDCYVYGFPGSGEL